MSTKCKCITAGGQSVWSKADVRGVLSVTMAESLLSLACKCTMQSHFSGAREKNGLAGDCILLCAYSGL